MDIQQQAKTFKAVADGTRLRILRLLPAEPICKEMYNVGELVEAIGGSQPNMSRHLQVLKEAGLVQCRKACSSVYYWRVAEAFERIGQSLLQFARSSAGGVIRRQARPGRPAQGAAP